MTEYDVIDETTDERFRVVLVQDLWPNEPEDDGGPYVFGLDWRFTHCIAEVRQQPTGDPYADDMRAGVARAMSRWGTDWDRIERYLTTAWDAVAVQRYDRRGGGHFLAVVTADMLAEWGGNVALVRESELLSEWEAYDEGDVWGYEIQRRWRWSPCCHCAHGDDMRPDHDADCPVATGRGLETWEHEDSCWGFFGRECAEEFAREAFALFTSVRGAA